MKKITLGSSILLKCTKCSSEYAASDADTCLDREISSDDHGHLKYKEYIKNAPHDPTVKRVERTCPKCGLGTMSLLRLGSEQKIIFICDDGHSFDPHAFTKTSTSSMSSATATTATVKVAKP